MVTNYNGFDEKVNFSILDYLDQLVPTKEGKYICPNCQGKNFTVDEKTGKFNCWNGLKDCTQEIPKILNPNKTNFSTKKSQSKKSVNPKIKPIEDQIILATINADQWEKAVSYGNKIIYPYSDHQWIERVQKGNDKEFYYHHLDDKGSSKKGKGDRPWYPYGYQFIEKIENKEVFKNQYVIALEGQKDVETVLSLGFCAIDYKMIDDNFLLTLGQIFKGLIVIPDNDKTGQDYAQKLSEKSHLYDLECLVVPLNLIDENIKEKWDITDILESMNNDVDKLNERLQTAIKQSQKLHNTNFDKSQQDTSNNYQKKNTTPSSFNPDDIPASSDIANEIAEENRAKLLFNNEIKSWLYYELENKGVWSVVDDLFVKQLIVSYIDCYYYNSSYVSSVYVLLMIKLCQHKWKTRLNLIPFLDGVYNLETNQFEEHCSGNKLTYVLPRNYRLVNQKDNFDFIDQWLTDVTQNDFDKQILISYLAAILRGRSELQKFLYLIGTGGSGKSTFTNLAIMLVGKLNSISMGLDDLNDKFRLSQIVNKRLIIFPDQDAIGSKVSKFKSLVGQDAFQVEEKFKPSFSYTFEGMSILTSNKFVFGNSSNEQWLQRRLIQIPFNNRCDKYKGKQLTKIFETELTAFTHYLLSMDNNLITQVLSGNDNKDVSYEYWIKQVENDGLTSWINGEVIFDDLAVSHIGKDKNEYTDFCDYDPQLSSLYGSYAIHCKAMNKQPLSLNIFSSNLLEVCNNVLNKNITKKRISKGYVILGLRLRTLFDDHIKPCDENLKCSPQCSPNVALDVDPKPSLCKGYVDHVDLFQVNAHSEKNDKHFSSCNEKTENENKDMEKDYTDYTTLDTQGLQDYTKDYTKGYIEGYTAKNDKNDVNLFTQSKNQNQCDRDELLNSKKNLEGYFDAMVNHKIYFDFSDHHCYENFYKECAINKVITFLGYSTETWFDLLQECCNTNDVKLLSHENKIEMINFLICQLDEKLTT